MDFNLLNKFSKDQIIKNFHQHESSKNLVLSKDIVRVVDRIVKINELKEAGLNKIYFLENNLYKDPLNNNYEWIYIVRPEIEYIKMICNHIKNDLKMNIPKKYPYKIIFSPRKLFICDLIFEKEGIFEYVILDELGNDFILLDTDLISMELPKFFSHCFLYGDQSWYMPIAKALMNIQDWFGKIPKVHCHGANSKNILNLMNRLQSLKETSVNSGLGNNQFEIGQLIIVDRDIDFITPFCTPLTYEGLLDESFKINAGFIDLVDAADSTRSKRVELSNNDKIFQEIRSMHIAEVMPFLKTHISNIKAIEEKRKDLKEIADIKQFIQTDLKDYTRLKDLIKTHLNISEKIIREKSSGELENYLNIEHSILGRHDFRKAFDYIEELMNRQFDMYLVLRLMILLSKTNDGLSGSDYNQLTNQFLHNYGFDKIQLLNKLQKVGLFESNGSIVNNLTSSYSNDSKSNLLKNTDIRSKLVQQLATSLKYSTNYGNITKKLDILPGNLNPMVMKSKSNDTDMSYAFNGQYRPILCKYISQILLSENSNRINLPELSKLFPGDYEKTSTTSHSLRLDLSTRTMDARKTILILFVGGCSYAEIGVLKHFALANDFKFIFATTSFLNARSVNSSFLE